jgi:hypothetical protein
MVEKGPIPEDLARRKRAAEELAQIEIEDVPDPETLSRQLADAHKPGGID